jgi:predicted membrane-bound spermidine synthase
MNLRFITALLLAAGSGFIALGYEIVWARLYNFVSGSRGEAFSAMLGSYLLGLAGGSMLSRWWQRGSVENRTVSLVASRLLLLASLGSFLVLPAVSYGFSTFPRLTAHPYWTLVCVALAALGLGTVLPLLCHYSISADKYAGQRVALIYTANIAGSALGSLVTGFVLLNKIGSAGTNTLLLGVGVGLALVLTWNSRPARFTDCIGLMAVVAIAVGVSMLQGDVFTRLFLAAKHSPNSRVTQLVETRNGVIVVDTNGTIYGNNVYDGTLETRLRPGTGLIRPYFISALHPDPREVLVVGVSGGAWTQILAHNPHVEKVTAVEINRGYLEVIRQHTNVSSLLKNPKVELVFDDGRRWMGRNPERRFDVIVMNTTFHWREFASALLSREFLELAKAHLKPGGITMWNCTGSARAIRTGMEVFPHTIMVVNNCVGSEQPLIIDRKRWRMVLEQYQIDGKPIFDEKDPAVSLNEILSFGESRKYVAAHWFIRTRESMNERYGGAKIITDDNLGTEFRSVLDDAREVWRW